MKKRVPTRLLLAIVPAIALIIFNVVLFVVLGEKVTSMRESFWCGYSFIMVGFATCIAITLLSKMKGDEMFAQKIALPFVIGIYMFLNLIVNVFALIFHNKALIAFVLINIVLLLIFVAIVVLTFLGLRHISENRQEVVEKVNYLNSVKATCQVLVERATEPTFKMALKNLLEDITYSDPMSGDNPDIIKEESKLKGILDSIEEGMDALDMNIEGTTIDALKQLVLSANNCLKKRNALVKASKS